MTAHPTEKILVVDDTPGTLEVIKRNLDSKGYNIFTATNVQDAIEILESTVIDLTITDFKMPGADGFDLLRHILENYKDMEAIMITGFPSLQGAVRAVKIGAEEYLAKPFTDEELFTAVSHALNKLRKRRKSVLYPAQSPHHGLIGESQVMQKVCNAIRKASKTMATVLICGESGTGKEIVARAIHYGSQRASAAFIPINCGAIPENLLESELFGYVKGAFTGATESRAGFFQTADKGTIFLDEISEASLAMQVKLLRILQDKEAFMLGSSQPVKIDVRIMAATNKDLEALVKKGLFREDLFYRLNVISINVPPLRERAEDVLLLIRHFTAKFAKELGKPAPQISAAAMQTLKGHHWPGNVRELENIIQRLVLMCESEMIDVADLPSFMRFSAFREEPLTRTLDEVETAYIKKVLASVGENKTRAAGILGIDRKTLREKLEKIK
ncbi:MAG: sigma-54-dependent Fis family transcriptional regulator [Desulfobacteraceae bacterium]|nr:MAG: sigma-54-dependent Fis family transcriptional regulator [Desulfobacteraceae bacterium]